MVAGAMTSTGGDGAAGDAAAAGGTSDAGATTTVGGSAGTGGTPGNAGAPSETTCRTGTFGGHDYEMCDAPAIFVDAASDCESRGLRLTKVESDAEHVWVHSMIPQADKDNNSTSLWRWLGGDDMTTVGDWRWSDGTAFWSGNQQGSAVGGAYEHWANNQPLTQDFCLAMEARNGNWFAMDCSDARPYVCELY
jgi:hypothetical protein